MSYIENKIVESIDAIKPSDTAKERMLSNIRRKTEAQKKTTKSSERKPEARRMGWVKWVAVAACFAIIISVSVLIANRNTPTAPVTPDSQVIDNKTTSEPDIVKMKPEEDRSLSSLLRRDDFSRIIWSNDDADLPYSQLGNVNMTMWNGINVTDSLLKKLNDAEEDEMFAVVIKSTLKSLEFNDYVYEGKSGAEIYKKLTDLYFTTELYREMKEFSEAGEEGIKKFLEFVVPDFERVYGVGFADKYYKNGIFDVDLITEDLQNEENLLTEAAKEYEKADERFRIEVYPNAFYLEKCGGTSYSGYHEGTDYHYTIVVLKKSALATVSKIEDHKWLDLDHLCFSLVKLSEEDINYENREPDVLTEIDDMNEVPETEMP